MKNRSARYSSSTFRSFHRLGADLKRNGFHIKPSYQHLPAQQKLVFGLYKLEGETYEQVSQELGISTSTINQHIVRATKSIKEFMFNYNHVAVRILLASVISYLAKSCSMN